MAVICLVIIAVISCVVCLALAELHTCVLVANKVKKSAAVGNFHIGRLMIFNVSEADGALRIVSLL